MPFIVYLLWNTVNDKTYVGVTNDYQRRLLEHENRTYLDTYLARAIRKHGWINKSSDTKMIYPYEFDTYKKQGWNLGRKNKEIAIGI